MSLGPCPRSNLHNAVGLLHIVYFMRCLDRPLPLKSCPHYVVVRNSAIAVRTRMTTLYSTKGRAT